MSSPKLSLLDQVRSAIRLRHYSIRTEEAYVNVIRRYIIYHRKRHPKEMGTDEIRQYLSHLANVGQVSASTQNQALSALLFLYREVLGVELPFIEGVERAKQPARARGLDEGRGEPRARLSLSHSSSNGEPAVRVGLEVDGVRSPQGEGHRLRL